MEVNRLVRGRRRLFPGSLTFSVAELKGRGLGAATDSEALPQLEPGALGEHLVVPAIGGSNVALGERTNVRSFEHLLKLLDVVDDAFDVHAVPII